MRVSAGTEGAPDIYFMWAGLGLGGEFISLGVSDPLDAEYESMGWNDRFLGSSLTKTMYDGHHHGVPYTNHGMVVYYRSDLFERAGITESIATVASWANMTGTTGRIEKNKMILFTIMLIDRFFVFSQCWPPGTVSLAAYFCCS